MKEAVEIVQGAVLALCLFGLAMCAIVGVAVLVRGALGELGEKFKGRAAQGAAFAVAAVVAILYGGTKPPQPTTGRFYFDTYLTDAGSVLSNGTAHVAATKNSAIIPDTTPVRVYARELAQTNAEDWVELMPRRTLAELPADYALENATNHNVLVSLDWTPPTPVITNLLFQATPKIVLGYVATSNGLIRIVVPRSALIKENQP